MVKRRPYIGREAKISFFQYDADSQTSSKIERGQLQNILKVNSMLENGLVNREKLLHLFGTIEKHFYNFPVIDLETFAQDVNSFVGFPQP